MFDVVGARSAGYSDGEIASFLGSQSGFDVDGATKAGYAPSEIVGFLSQQDKPPPADLGPAPTGDPLTRVTPSASAGGTFTLAQAQPAQDAGAGRGFVNPPNAAQPESIRENMDRLDKNITGSVISGTREMAGAAGIATLAPAKAIDFVHGLITGKSETGAQDYAGRTFVDPNFTAAEQWAPKPEDETHIAGKVLNGLARMVPTLATAIATGGTSAVEQGAMGLEAVRQAIVHGMRSMSVPAFSSGIAKSADLIRQGAPIGEAVTAGLTEGATSDITGGLAMSTPGANLASRFAQGAAVGATTGDVARQAQNLAAPDFQTERTPEGTLVSALTGGVLAGSMGHPSQGKVPDRIDLGYDPLSGKTAAAQAAQSFDGRPQEVAPSQAQRPDAMGRIMGAATVDDAIRAAQEVVSPKGNLAEDTLAIRPLDKTLEQQLSELPSRKPNVSQPSDVQPLDTAADGGRSDVPGVGLEAGVGADRAAEPAVDAGRVRDEPASEPVPLEPRGGDGAVEPVKTWFGRRGDGYVTQGDASMAMVSRQKADPDLNWRIEAMPSGKFRLAGYAEEGAKSGDATPRVETIQAAPTDQAAAVGANVPRDQPIGRAAPGAVAEGANEASPIARDGVGHDQVPPDAALREPVAKTPPTSGVPTLASTRSLLDGALADTPTTAIHRLAERSPEHALAVAEARKALETARSTLDRAAPGQEAEFAQHAQKALAKFSDVLNGDKSRFSTERTAQAVWDTANAKNRQFFADKGGLEVTPAKRAALSAKSWADLNSDEQAAVRSSMESYGAVNEAKPAADDSGRLFTRATNEPVTTPKDVVGKEGGRSADDETTGAAQPFRDWFKDSKVTDADGKPLVLYHGTPIGEIKQFSENERGIFFTDDPKVANEYTLHRGMWRSHGEGAVYPVHLALKNPLVIDAMGKRNDNIPVPWATWKPKVYGNLPKGAVSVADALKYAKENGHDGLIVKNVVDTAHVTDTQKSNIYAAFKPEQVRSAFDANDATAPNRDGAHPYDGQGTIDLHAGLNPKEAIKALGKGYSAYGGVERVPHESRGTVADSIAKALIPAGRVDAQLTAGIIRANLGEQARGREVAQQHLMEFAKRFDKMPVEENYKFIDAMERGVPLKDPEMSRAAVAIRKVLDERRDQVIALGKGNLENFNENYFPHIWKDKAGAANFFTRRPLEGGKGFLKQRTYDFFSDGLKAGLEPVTTNPVELAMLKAREMDRYIYGQRIFAEMKAAGVAKFVGFADKAPDGWVKINDKIARVMQYSEAEKAMILRGEYYAPEQAATLINNHLSPGLSGVAAFDMIRKAGNMMNAAQLGLSAFHLGFTTLDAMISKAALGIKQASRGNVIKGAGNVAQSLNPLQPLMNLYKGDKLLKAYLGNLSNPEIAPIVEALTQAGGRVKMDDVYRNAAVNEFRQAIRKGNYGTAALKAIPRAMDLINKPIFEYLVPRQKLGVFFDMAKDALEKNPGMTLDEKRQVMGKLWDSVDNRMGELVYDNVFWNRALKDALMVSVRSVGWNLGTFREIGGGVKDIKDIGKLGGLSDRTAYILGLTFVTAIIGSMTQYLMTGEAPKELKDVFFPRTGKERPDGTQDRLSLPSYMKDVFEYGHDIRNFAKYGEDPFHTLENKMHPLISTLGQIFTNKDFFGGAIRSPGDSSAQQAVDEATYLLKQMTPFSLRNYEQQAKLKGEDPSIAGYLSSPSMIGITPAPGYITKTDEEAESSQVNKMRESLITKFREEMRDGADWVDIKDRAVDAGLSERDREYIKKAAVPRPPKRLKEFATH